MLAGEQFREAGFPEVADDEPHSIQTLATYARDGRSWVALDPANLPVGYVLVDIVDGCAHVEQVSVRPDHQGEGLGKALLGQVHGWARDRGLSAITLTTFVDVSWNAPLYRRLGFRELSEGEIGPELRAVRAEETAHGLDPTRRTCMRADLQPAAGSDAGCSAVFTFRARAGQEERLLQWTHRIVSAARRHEGNLAAAVVGPDETGQYQVVHHFRDDASLQSWLESTERADLHREGEALLEAPPDVQRTGLETWFQPPSGGQSMVPPPRWKMWLISLLAIYPLVLAFQAWVSPHITHWPLAVRAAALPLVVLTLMTFVIMPNVTRALRKWLTAERR